MKRAWMPMLPFCVVLLMIGCGKGKEEGAPKAGMAQEFSATVVSQGGGQAVISKIFIKDGKVRTEIQTAPGTYIIVRPDLSKTWTVMTASKSYMEMPIKKELESRVPAEKVKGEISRKAVGSETIDGHPTTKYELTAKPAGEKAITSYQWWATDIHFPVKTAAVDGSWSVTYKDIKIGGQPDGLFEVPAGYAKMSIPAMPGIPGMPKQGRK
jgi:hypothetical protein